MRKVLWGAFFGALIGVILLAPDSLFAYRVRETLLAVFLILVVVGFAFYDLAFKPFTKRWAENQADIKSGVEDLKLELGKKLEDHKTENHLRVSVIENRFQAHQEAYRLCNNIVNGPLMEIRENYNKLRDWWSRNCLYLDPKPRERFLDAIQGADLLVIWHDEDRIYKGGKWDTEALKQQTIGLRLVSDAMQALEEAVGVPPIKSDKLEVMKDKTSDQAKPD